MSDLQYTCTACALELPGIGALADHIVSVHEPGKHESALDQYRRRALNLPDDDDDDDDDEAEDQLLPTRLPDVARRLAELEAHLSVAIAERNAGALHHMREELERLSGHWRICAEQLLRQSQRAERTRQLAEWVLQEGCEVVR